MVLTEREALACVWEQNGGNYWVELVSLSSPERQEPFSEFLVSQGNILPVNSSWPPEGKECSGLLLWFVVVVSILIF